MGQRIEGSANTGDKSSEQILLLDVANGEYISHICGRSGDWIDNIVVSTSKGRRLVVNCTSD